MPSFPSWSIAVLIASIGVWGVSQYNTAYAWSLAILLVLGVLITRDTALSKFNEFIGTVLSGETQVTTSPVQSPV